MTNKILLSALAAGTLALAANPANADKWSFQIEPLSDYALHSAIGKKPDHDFLTPSFRSS